MSGRRAPRKDARLAMELARDVGVEAPACARAATAWNTGIIGHGEDFNRLTAAILAGARA
jgi:hypothetical protein